jgi:hypothetical protein
MDTCLHLLPRVHHPLHCGLLGHLWQCEVGIDVDVDVGHFGSLFRLLALFLLPFLRFWRLDWSMLVVHLELLTVLLQNLLVNFVPKVT